MSAALTNLAHAHPPARELDGIAASLIARHPDLDPNEIRVLVGDAYQELAETARVHTHLVALTLNRCQRILTAPQPIATPTRWPIA